MKKTSVYFSDEEAAELRRLSHASGRSQAQLIREGVRIMLNGGKKAERRFGSLGRGHGGGASFSHWTSDELHEAVIRQ